MRTSLGIWALGSMVTRFVPGGYQPEHGGETTVQRVRRAVEGLEGLIDDYEFHYPGELNPDNLDDVREALDGHGIYTVCTGLHLDPRFGRGGLVSPDQATRAEARRLTRETAELAGSEFLCSRKSFTPWRPQISAASAIPSRNHSHDCAYGVWNG